MRQSSVTLLAAAACATGLLVVACGGGSKSPSAPSPSPSTPTPNPPTTGWSVKGQVVATVGGQPVPSARLTFDSGQTTAGPDGTFTYSNASTPANPYKVTVEAPGFVTREVYLNWRSGTREGVVIDIIRDGAPFSLDFYRQFVRDQNDSDVGLRFLRRWTDNPRFYIRTVEPSGRSVEPEVLALVRSTIPRAVTAFTGGRLFAATIEQGTEERAQLTGWINVSFIRDPKQDICGRATVGGPTGWLILNNDRCNCGSVKVPPEVVMHEVGHSMGFWHVKGRENVMYYQDPGGCPVGELSPAERTHVNIAYQRPVGNLDQDRDPTTGAFFRSPGDLFPTPPIIVVN